MDLAHQRRLEDHVGRQRPLYPCDLGGLSVQQNNTTRGFILRPVIGDDANGPNER
jgi:hypothetical protein